MMETLIGIRRAGADIIITYYARDARALRSSMKKPVDSQKLFARASQILPGGVDSPVRAFQAVGGAPLFISRASGAIIEDVDGNRFIDYVMSWGPLIHGHAPRGLVQGDRRRGAARHQLRRAERRSSTSSASACGR